jgi:cyclopropane fatty-acyl-phospholipid synthase-like methyltransferase
VVTSDSSHESRRSTAARTGTQADLAPLLQPDRYPLSARYDAAWVLGLDMGPHPLWQLEDLLGDLTIRPGGRVLDLGCGRGATSVFLARELDVDVAAFDLWISEEELRATAEEQGVSERVTAVNGDVRHLPFEDGAFDAVVSIDAFEYFGTDVHLLPRLLRVLKPGGAIGMTTPALRTDPYESAPPAHVTDVVGGEAAAWHAPHWWATHWQLSGLVGDVTARMQSHGHDDWTRWLSATDPTRNQAVIDMLATDGGAEIGIAVVSALKR